MRNIIAIIGILLVLAGIGILAYRGYSYQTQEKIAEFGNVQLTAQETKTVYLPPLLGGVSIVVGIVLVVAGRKK